MAEIVGLSNPLTLEQMEKAVQCSLSGYTIDEAREVLDEQISRETKSKDNIRKKRDMLLNMWYRPEDWLLEQCKKVAVGLPEDERIPLHWLLLLSRYRMYYDLCSVIGGLFDYRDEITAGQIKSRIFEKWGARNTIDTSLPKIMKIVRELKAVNAIRPVGTYTKNTIKVSNVQTIQLLCVALLTASEKEYLSWEELIQHSALFPFSIVDVTLGDIASCEKLSLERMGDGVVIRVTQL